MDRILQNIERITKLARVTDAERREALQVSWDAYAKVLATVKTDSDESWGNAARIGTSFKSGLDMVDDQDLYDLITSGHADDDGRD